METILIKYYNEGKHFIQKVNIVAQVIVNTDFNESNDQAPRSPHRLPHWLGIMNPNPLPPSSRTLQLESAADTIAGPPFSNFAGELQRIRQLIAAAPRRSDPGALPGNACFLADGRVLCRPRRHGDSRYPYGHGGFNFWVYASGYMHANEGLFHILLPASAGQDPPVAFLAGSRPPGAKTFTPLGLLPTPYLPAGEATVARRGTVIGHDDTYFLTDADDLRGAVRVHLDQSGQAAAQLFFSLQLTNPAATAREYFVAGVMDLLCRHQFAVTHEDRWFKTVELLEGDADARIAFAQHGEEFRAPLPAFQITVNEDVSRSESVTHRAFVERCVSRPAGATERPTLVTQTCTGRTDFVGGQNRGLTGAGFLTSGELDRPRARATFTDNAIMGDLHRFELAAGESIRFDYVLCLPDPARKQPARRLQPLTPDASDRSLCQVRAARDAERHDLELQFSQSRIPKLPERTLNDFLPFLIKQVAVCAQIKGYLQPSPNSLIGVRDVFQALEAQVYDQPQAARAKVLEALEYVLIDGRCPRQYSLPVNGRPGTADLREFIDQGVWVISTMHTYLRVTGDFAILDEPLGYHRVDPTRHSALARADDRDSVLDHLLRIMKYLERQRDPRTQLVLALYGDWNDALDGLGVSNDPRREFGTGVSVMVSLQLYRNCAEMIEILQAHHGLHSAQIERYHDLRGQLRAGLLRHAVDRRDDACRILHGWGDDRAYLVGGFNDCDGRARDALTSNAFWVLAGLLDEFPEFRHPILDAFERLDGPYGLRTFAPGFAPDAPGVGRIPKLPIGTAENGATYIHATTFAIMALFRMGQSQAAWNQICKILPIATHHTHFSHSPFVMPNSYVHNSELGLDGESMNDWQTGCSNVLLKILIHDVAGFQPEFTGLRIAPAPDYPFGAFTFVGRAHGRRIRIEYSVDELAKRIRRPRKFKALGIQQEVIESYSDDRGDAIWIPYSAIPKNQECLIQI
jgi:cellobiose phosphorylase